MNNRVNGDLRSFAEISFFFFSFGRRRGNPYIENVFKFPRGLVIISRRSTGYLTDNKLFFGTLSDKFPTTEQMGIFVHLSDMITLTT